MTINGANAKLVQKGECWTWDQGVIRGNGSILTGGNILLLDFFCIHVVKHLMPILALLPISSSLWSVVVFDDFLHQLIKFKNLFNHLCWEISTVKLVLAPIYLREKLINPFSTQYTFLSGVMEKKAEILYAKFNVHGLQGKLGSLYQFRR